MGIYFNIFEKDLNAQLQQKCPWLVCHLHPHRRGPLHTRTDLRQVSRWRPSPTTTTVEEAAGN
jgi:hypothetical protein